MKTLFNLRANTPNIGNELIAVGMNAVLQSVFTDHVNLVTLPAAGGPGVTGAGLTRRTIYDINQLADGLIIGPGNLFENGGIEIDAGALGALTTPAMLFGVSTGRVFDRTGELVARTDALGPDQTRAVCRAADRVLVRDRATRDTFDALGCQGALVAGCPSLFLDECLSRLPPPDPSLANTVLISIRHPRLMSVPERIRGKMPGDVHRLVAWFKAQGRDVRLLCHDYQDLSQAQAFGDVPAMYTQDPYRFLSWLRSCALNVTFRLHAFLACLTLGVPSIPLTYDERGMSLIETIGMSAWQVCFVHTADVPGAVQQRAASLDQFQEQLADAQPTIKGLRAAMVEGVQDFARRLDERASRLRF